MIIENIIAVAMGVGRTYYMMAINERYEASPMCRIMLHQLNLFWAIPALSVGVGVTATVVHNMMPKIIAYGIGTAMVMIRARNPC